MADTDCNAQLDSVSRRLDEITANIDGLTEQYQVTTTAIAAAAYESIRIAASKRSAVDGRKHFDGALKAALQQFGRSAAAAVNRTGPAAALDALRTAVRSPEGRALLVEIAREALAPLITPPSGRTRKTTKTRTPKKGT